MPERSNPSLQAGGVLRLAVETALVILVLSALLSFLDGLLLGAAEQGGRGDRVGLLWLVELLGSKIELWEVPLVPELARPFLPVDGWRDAIRLASAAVAGNLVPAAGLALIAFLARLAVRRLLRPRAAGGNLARDPLILACLLLAAAFALRHLMGSRAMASLAEAMGIAGLGPTDLSHLVLLAALPLSWWGVRVLLASPRRRKVLALAGGGIVAGSALVTLGAWILVPDGASPATAKSAEVPARPYPNILLISLDTLRADHIGASGYERATSPAIDAIARDGAYFSKVVSPSSWTLPTHLTMLTGLPPRRHGVIDTFHRLAPSAETLAEVLARSGYRTAGFVSGPYLRSEFGFHQGYRHYDDYTVAATHTLESHQQITSPDLLGLVRSWLTQWSRENREQPFFVFLHMWDPHYDFIPPSPYDETFDPDYEGGIGEVRFTSDAVHPGMDPRDLEHLVALYDGEIRFTDEHIGRLLDHLRELGVADDTIVAVTGDHGEEFYEHGAKGHRHTLYDELLLVPLALRYPGHVPAGVVVDRQVRMQDLPTTLLDLAGVPGVEDFGLQVEPERYASRSLAHHWSGEQVGGEVPAFADLHGELVCVRTDRAKLILNLDTQETELYDLLTDPEELRDLSSSNPVLQATLRQELDTWLQALRKDALESMGRDLNEQELEVLRSLGYVD